MQSESAEARTEVTLDEALGLALEALSRRQFEPAIDMFEKILEVKPNDGDVWNYWGIANFHLKGATAGAAALERAAKEAPQHAGIRNNLGNTYIELREIDKAVDEYDKAIELDPTLPDPFCNLAAVMRHNGNPEFAEKLLRKALDLKPDFGVAHQNLAMILMDSGRPKAAIEHFWKATVYLPQKAIPSHFLAMAYWHAGLKDQAADYVRKWAEASPGDAQAQHVKAAMTGEAVPERASDDYVRSLFDQFSRSFDAKLDSLGYKAPQVVAKAVADALGEPKGTLEILDAGCGTGKCGRYLKPYAKILAGVDLSGGMLIQADKLGLYDDLERGELTHYLASTPNEWDAVVSADTLCYFGRLEEFAAAALSSLRPGGVLIFTVEVLSGEPPPSGSEGYKLAVHGRYQHERRYVETCLRDAGFAPVIFGVEALRNENDEPVMGYVVTAIKPRLH